MRELYISISTSTIIYSVITINFPTVVQCYYWSDVEDETFIVFYHLLCSIAQLYLLETKRIISTIIVRI